MVKKLLSPFLTTLLRITLVCFLLGGVVSGCNSDAGNKKLKKSKIENKDDADDADDDNGNKPRKVNEDDEDISDSDDTGSDTKIAKEVCNCLDDIDQNLSTQAKKMFIKAAKSTNPQRSIQQSLQAVDDQDTQRQLAEEFQSLDEAMKGDCLKKIDAKYNLENVSAKRKKQLVSALEKNCSDFIATIMRIAVEKEGGGDDEETDY